MGRQPLVIAPSVLSADLAALGQDVAAVLAAGGDWIHFDVMDNHYVPNLTFGPVVCASLRRYGIVAPIDVHLMVQPVDNLITMFAKAGATSITFHPEASANVVQSLERIRAAGCKAGLAFNPDTPVSVVLDVLDLVDMILLMSVNPGFAGQAFIPYVLDKARDVRVRIDESGYPIRLAMDGGINLENVRQVVGAGVDTVVAGSAIFGTKDYRETLKAFRHLSGG